MPGQSGARRADLERLCRGRATAVDGQDAPYPLFVYSYSSRGFTDLAARYAATRHLPPTHLVSLYDLHYHLSEPLVAADPGDRRARFVDSGGYEVSPFPDPDRFGQMGPPGREPWTAELYVAAARSHVRPGDTLVSFDEPALLPAEQVRRGLDLFDRLALQDVRRDLLVHPNGMGADDPAELAAGHADAFDILGLTEKDIGEPWFVGAAYLRAVRAALNARLGRYMPIHVFGCLDPRTLPYLFFAGGDIFDGLAWMRLFFRAGHAYYVKEMEHHLPARSVLDPATALQALLGHNVAELERLRNDLQFSVLAGEPGPFADCLEALLALEGAVPVAAPADAGD